MKFVNTHRRANAVTKFDQRKSFEVKRLIDEMPTTTRSGRRRWLGVRLCGCGRYHWGQRDRLAIGKQKEVAKLCPECFEKKYMKKRPPQFRFLSEKELEGQKRIYAAQGCTVSHVDPSTL